MDRKKLNEQWQFEERVRQYICEHQCGTDFDKPCSCEECMEDEQLKIHFDYELKKARKLGENYFR